MESENTHLPLTDDEIGILDDFLLYADVPDSMTLDMLDGYLHALAIGPKTVTPQQWIPRIWGEDFAAMRPPTQDAQELDHILVLITRLHDGIVANLEHPDGPSMVPLWSTFQDHAQERDDAEIWAYGFITGMKFCEEDWAALLATQQGQAWLRPIRLLGEEDFGPERDALIKTPADRERVSLEIPECVLAMYAYWQDRRSGAESR